MNSNYLADNTNADVETRAVWNRLAAKFGIPIRCVYFATPAKVCEHNDTVRALAKGPFNPEKRSILPHSAFSSFVSRFKEPAIEEGFQDITRIDFQVSACPRMCAYAYQSRSTVPGRRSTTPRMGQILDLIDCRKRHSTYPLRLLNEH